MDFAEFFVGIRPVIPHHEIGNNRRVARLDAEDIVPLDADAVTDLDDEERNGVLLLQLAEVRDRYRRCCDGDLASQEDRQRSRRSAHGYISDFPERVALHIGNARILGRGCACIAGRCFLRGRCCVADRSAAEEGIYFLLRDHFIAHSRLHPLL